MNKNTEQPVVSNPAVYSEQVIPHYQGNPLIEALPPILKKQEIYTKLANYPKVPDLEKQLDSVYRFQFVRTIKDYFQPFQQHIELEQRFSASLRYGYSKRNPLDSTSKINLYENHESLTNHAAYELNLREQGNEGNSGFVVVGSSGIGKSTTVDRILTLYPQVISHEKYTRVQITYLKLQCSYDGGLKGLCYNFFEQIDLLLGTNHLLMVQRKSFNVDMMQTFMEQLANLYCIGILIIDEIQHLSVAKSGGANKMLNFFVSLMNKISLPVILIGTPKSISILSGEFRNTRRLTGDGPIFWDAMENDKIWRLYMEGLWEYQWTKTYTPLSDAFINLLHEESQGILDVVRMLFQFTQEKIITNGGKEIITPQIIKQVKREKFRLMEKMLKALEEDTTAKLGFEDIRPVRSRINPLNQKPLTKQELIEELQEQEKYRLEKEVIHETKLEKVISKLRGMGIGQRKAKQYAQLAINELGDKVGEEKLALKAVSYEFSNDVDQTDKDLILNKSEGLLDISVSSSDSEVIANGIKEKGFIDDSYIKRPL
ncbi:ATP-binding protein [Halalkalibacter akibai]|uniref:Transposon Tn7 transposition protein tnsC n=1 Tax=Halalkalibacter akibai (strain ATCC 43226 / DSM 21942 / CIP 109018 / JCM 9157 / 1139) TaxID=1236973 RepID=W4QYR8_HALA3|nr:ATP-binding protein [Halalkalibacter akibai]GAE36818.1 transposon Tn7 transposition protein tnsC [Halalkalibacter akibai JCM 9157]